MHCKLKARKKVIESMVVNANSAHIHLRKDVFVGGMRRKTNRHTETLTKAVPTSWSRIYTLEYRMKCSIWFEETYWMFRPNPFWIWRLATTLCAMEKA